MDDQNHDDVVTTKEKAKNLEKDIDTITGNITTLFNCIDKLKTLTNRIMGGMLFVGVVMGILFKIADGRANYILGRVDGNTTSITEINTEVRAELATIKALLQNNKDAHNDIKDAIAELRKKSANQEYYTQRLIKENGK